MDKAGRKPLLMVQLGSTIFMLVYFLNKMPTLTTANIYTAFSSGDMLRLLNYRVVILVAGFS